MLHGSPISHKNVKCNSLCHALAIDPLAKDYDFKILHYICHKMKYVSPLRVAVLTCIPQNNIKFS